MWSAAACPRACHRCPQSPVRVRVPSPLCVQEPPERGAAPVAVRQTAPLMSSGVVTDASEHQPRCAISRDASLREEGRPSVLSANACRQR